MFPIDAVSDFGAWLVRSLGPLTSLRRIAETNLRLVFPNATDAEIARLLRAQWEELGRWIAEFPILDRIAAEPERIEVQGLERLTPLTEAGHPAVLISGHFSNFDVMAVAIVRAGVQCQITYRATNNPYVNDRIIENRRRYGVKMFAPKGTQGAREMFRAIARGESIALLNDQKFNGGVAAPFFGHLAYTAPGPSTYALHFGIPIQPMSVQRLSKARFKVIVHAGLSGWKPPATAKPTSRRVSGGSTPLWRRASWSDPRSGSGSTSGGRRKSTRRPRVWAWVSFPALQGFGRAGVKLPARGRAPVAQLLQRDFSAGHRAEHIAAGLQHGEIAVAVVQPGQVGGREVAIVGVHGRLFSAPDPVRTGRPGRRAPISASRAW